jgi:hypothetical protein
MKQLLTSIFLFCASNSIAQTVFFQSAQSYSKKEMETFYSSISLQNNLLLFNAPDYGLYAYDKASGKQLWHYDLQRKSNKPPYFAGNFIWATSKDEKVWQLDTATGIPLKLLPFTSVETPPFEKNGILYGTGIYDGGCLYAYDIKLDTVVWKRFLAHGCSVQPYYLTDKIVANAEANNWLEVRYDGKLVDAACEGIEVGYPSELPCIKTFTALTHDGKEIRGKLAEDVVTQSGDAPDIVSAYQQSFIFSNGLLKIVGNNLKLKSSLHLLSLAPAIDEDDRTLAKIIKAEKENLWIVYSNHLFIYNYQKKKLVKTIDLNAWQPHQVIADDSRLWVISKKDGLLYGLDLN